MNLSPRERRLIDFALCFVAANLLDDSTTDSLFTEIQTSGSEERDELSEELHALAQRIQERPVVLLRQDEQGYGIWVDGEKCRFHKTNDGIDNLMHDLAQHLGFDLKWGPPQSCEEYEEDWC